MSNAMKLLKRNLICHDVLVLLATLFLFKILRTGYHHRQDASLSSSTNCPLSYALAWKEIFLFFAPFQIQAFVCDPDVLMHAVICEKLLFKSSPHNTTFTRLLTILIRCNIKGSVKSS